MIGAIWLLLATQAAAGPVRESVMTLLNAHDTPVDAASVRALGSEARSELVEISNDASVPPTRRARAITALKFVPITDEVVRALRGHLRGAEPLLQRHAALSLAVLGNDAIGDLTAALGSSDVELRVAAAQALGRIATPRARAAATERLATEPHDKVRAALRKAQETG